MIGLVVLRALAATGITSRILGLEDLGFGCRHDSWHGKHRIL